jgi:hypothetical protein
MNRKRVAIIILAPIGIALFILIGGQLVMHLWNWLAPTLFGWRQINFWQAFGLLALCRILFGGVGVRGRRRFDGRRMGRAWEKMTPEQREKFRQGVRSRWGDCEPSTSEPKPSA